MTVEVLVPAPPRGAVKDWQRLTLAVVTASQQLADRVTLVRTDFAGGTVVVTAVVFEGEEEAAVEALVTAAVAMESERGAP